MVAESGDQGLPGAPEEVQVDAPRPAGAAAEGGSTMDEYDADFYMYKAKIQPCPRKDMHAFYSCPYAHPREPATRRDLKLFSYESVLCDDQLHTKACPRGEGCRYAHSTWEYFLHPTRFRTRMCDAGTKCSRPLCFFAHTPEELRERPVLLNTSLLPRPASRRAPGGFKGVSNGSGGSTHSDSPRAAVQVLSSAPPPTGLAAPRGSYDSSSMTAYDSSSMTACSYSSNTSDGGASLMGASPPDVTLAQVLLQQQPMQAHHPGVAQHNGVLMMMSAPAPGSGSFDVGPLGAAVAGMQLSTGFAPHASSSSMTDSAGNFAPVFAAASSAPPVMMAPPPMMQQQPLIVTTQPQQQMVVGAPPQLLTLAGGDSMQLQFAPQTAVVSAGGFVGSGWAPVAAGQALPQPQQPPLMLPGTQQYVLVPVGDAGLGSTGGMPVLLPHGAPALLC